MGVFSVEIVTPIKVFSEDTVKYLRCPGIDGSFGVMKKHRNGIIALDIGELKIKNKNVVKCNPNIVEFLKINNDKVELLLESIEKSNEIDVKRASEALERAKQRKADTKKDVDSVRLEASLSRAINRLNVSKK